MYIEKRWKRYDVFVSKVEDKLINLDLSEFWEAIKIMLT